MNKTKPNHDESIGKSEVSVIGKPINVNEVIIFKFDYMHFTLQLLIC